MSEEHEMAANPAMRIPGRLLRLRLRQCGARRRERRRVIGGSAEAIPALGGVPPEHRTNSLSAAFRNLTVDAEEGFTKSWDEEGDERGRRAAGSQEDRRRRGRQWIQHLIEYSTRQLFWKSWALDIDTSVKPLFRHQEGAVIAYNPTKPGRPSHVYHCYVMSTVRLMVEYDVAAGNKSSSKDCSPRLWSFIDRLAPEERPKLVRGDAGFGLHFVNPANTSHDRGAAFRGCGAVACSACRTVDSESRESQAVFVCRKCGFRAHANHNAAINILRRASSDAGEETTAVEHTVAARERLERKPPDETRTPQEGSTPLGNPPASA